MSKIIIKNISALVPLKVTYQYQENDVDCIMYFDYDKKEMIAADVMFSAFEDIALKYWLDKDSSPISVNDLPDDILSSLSDISDKSQASLDKQINESIE